MFLLPIATAALFSASAEVPLAPLERTWGGSSECDARAILVEAGETAKFPEAGRDEDPAGFVRVNQHVVDAWERARPCSTVARSLKGTFALFHVAQVLAASAQTQSDPVQKAEGALEVFAAGNDAAAGPMVATMVSRAVHMEAVGIVEEAWSSIGPDDRRRILQRLRALHAARPPMDLESERLAVREIAAKSWLGGTCIQAHAEALVHVEEALRTGPDALDLARGATVSEWLTGCGAGMEQVTRLFLEDEARIAATIASLPER